MDSTVSNHTPVWSNDIRPRPPHFIINKIISIYPHIVIGICGRKKANDTSNPLVTQCIRLNEDDALHSLKFYQQTPTSLCYEFESDIRLCLFKQPDGTILYNLKTPTRTTTTALELDTYKPTPPLSAEFDLIRDFVNKGHAVL
jgi:hypothetical protein